MKNIIQFKMNTNEHIWNLVGGFSEEALGIVQQRFGGMYHKTGSEASTVMYYPTCST